PLQGADPRRGPDARRSGSCGEGRPPQSRGPSVDGAKRHPALTAAAAALFLAAACAPSSPPAGAAAPSRWVPGPRGRIRVADGGGAGAGGRKASALPVLFVHGNSGNRTQWKAQLEHLRPTRRAAALDLHGMGESEKAPDGVYSVESFAADVAAAADALGLKRFVLVGHSYGGYVVSAYAGKHPDRLAGLVFADC